MQHGASLQTVQNYLGCYGERTVRRNINGTVDGFPAIFFVAATNAYGRDPSMRDQGSPFGICHDSR